MKMALTKQNRVPGRLRRAGLEVSRCWHRLPHPIRHLRVLFLCLAAGMAYGAETVLPEQHVKSLFLLNFAKYVEWPAESFGSSNAPIVIGLLRDKRLSAELVSTVEGKSIGGRPLVVRPLEKDDEISGCHILYVGLSEKARLKEILDRAQTKPLLTVSDIEQFARSGGIIGFIKREDKIRLEIDLEAAHQAGLQISSRLLGVADAVNRKR